MRQRTRRWLGPAALAIALLSPLATTIGVAAQGDPPYQTDFPPDEFKARWARIYDQIGERRVAVVQGVGLTPGFMFPRQHNEFYYLCGVETPGAYLMLDGRTRTATLYLPRRNTRLEAAEGRVLSADDAELVKRLTGVDAVAPVDAMRENWPPAAAAAPAGSRPTIYTPFAPAENYATSRGEAASAARAQVADYWDQRPSEELNFVHLLQVRLGAEVRDLTPILDELRSMKSPREIDLIRRASQIAALGMIEAMKATEPGVFEYQLDAAARYVFLANGARLDGYRSITAAGMTNIVNGHYYRNTSELKAGDLVLMDYAPDFRYYTSDVGRMWPVNGTFSPEQRALLGFILEYRNAVISRIRPGVSSQQVMEEARTAMDAGVRALELRQARTRAGRARDGAHRRRRVLASGWHGGARRWAAGRIRSGSDRSSRSIRSCGSRDASGTDPALHALRGRRRGDRDRLRELHGVHADDAGGTRARRAAERYRPGLSAQRDAVESSLACSAGL